jgi:hypothetical protein
MIIVIKIIVIMITNHINKNNIINLSINTTYQVNFHIIHSHCKTPFEFFHVSCRNSILRYSQKLIFKKIKK